MYRCRFCDDWAIGKFFLDEGCFVYPNDREQNLCWHHARESTPLNNFKLLEDYTLEGGMRVKDLMEM